MSTPSLPRAAFTPSEKRGECAASVPMVSQPSEAAPPIPSIGGFALAAIAHIKPPAGVIRS